LARIKTEERRKVRDGHLEGVVFVPIRGSDVAFVVGRAKASHEGTGKDGGGSIGYGWCRSGSRYGGEITIGVFNQSLGARTIPTFTSCANS